MGFLPETTLSKVGLASIVIGAALSVTGCLRFGKNIEFWSDHYQKYLTKYIEKYQEPKYTEDELKNQMIYTKNSAYLLGSGVVLMGVGAFIAGARTREIDIRNKDSYLSLRQRQEKEAKEKASTEIKRITKEQANEPKVYRL